MIYIVVLQELAIIEKSSSKKKLISISHQSFINSIKQISNLCRKALPRMLERYRNFSSRNAK